MKTHALLLLRDALAEIFVKAATGEPDARSAIEALRQWSEAGAGLPELSRFVCEDGGPVFEGDHLTERFEPLRSYAVDRARRFAAACEWMDSEDAFGDEIAGARCAWDAGLFFEVHEMLEPAWLAAEGERRQLLQGFIMAGAALHHLTLANRAGARGLLREAARRFAATSRDGAAAYDFATFGRELDALAARVESKEVTCADDIEDLPRLDTVKSARAPSD